jgi:sugar phosphate isomerase/epimerase
MPQLKIGLSMLYTLSDPFNVMLKELSKAETNIIEIVDDGTHALNQRRIQALKDSAKEYGLQYSVHGPFADINVASCSRTMLNSSLKRLKQSMQYASHLNAYLWVLHPGSKNALSAFYPGQDWTCNQESIKELHEYAKKLGLQVAMENLPEKYNFLMKTPQDFSRFYNETGLEDIGIVLDTGHAHLEAQIQPFLQILPKKIRHIHISDNHGEWDEHLGLGAGKIDWNQFATMVKASGFSGTVLCESVYDVKATVQKLKQLFN